MKHAIALGVIGTVIGRGGAAAWNRPEMGPHWYPLLLVVAAIPASWLGARMYAR